MKILSIETGKKLTKAVIIGALFGFIAYLISGDGGISAGLALLLIYLDYNLKQE